MQESSQGTERAHITQLLRPLRHALDTALAKHDREVDLGRRGSRPPLRSSERAGCVDRTG